MGDEQNDFAGLLPASPYIDTSGVRASSEYTSADPFAPQAAARQPALSDDTVDFSDSVAKSQNGKVSVMKELERDPELRMAAALYKSAGLAGQIEAEARMGGVTLYVPNDEAINRLPKGAKAKLLANTPAGKNVRARLMGTHVVPTNSGIQALGAGAMAAAQFDWEQQGPVAQAKGTFTRGAVLTENQVPRAGSEHMRVVLHNPQELAKVRAQAQVIRTAAKEVPGVISFKIHTIDNVLARIPAE